MRALLAALGVAAVLAAPTAAAPPRPQTLFESPAHQSISAFAQDGRLLAWLSPSENSCNRVHVLDLDDGLKIALPSTTIQNVTCRWDIVPPVRLAVAGQNVLWTLREAAPPAPLPFDYVLGSGIRDTAERRFQEIAHSSRGAGLWLGGVAGSDSSLVYAVTSVNYIHEVSCLADPSARGACAMRIVGGGVFRVVGRHPPQRVPLTGAAIEVSASGGAVAYVSAAKVGAGGAPLAAARLPVEVRNTTSGRLLAHVKPQGIPVAIALAQHLLATLERTPLGLRVAWYDLSTGAPIGSVPVPAGTSPELSASDRLIVFRVGRSIRAVDPGTNGVSTLTKAAATPIGLSIVGGRVAWAENVAGRGRIRSISVGAG
jgi:hypothetical protein